MSGTALRCWLMCSLVYCGCSQSSTDSAPPARSSGGRLAESVRAERDADPRETGGTGALITGSDVAVAFDKLEVSVVTTSCVDDCVMVTAIARGGNPPYTYTWHDGDTSATRTLCQGQGEGYEVVARDTAIDASEFGHAMLEARTTVDQALLACGGDACSAGGSTSIATGSYTGTLSTCAPGEQVELPDENGVSTIARMFVELDIDPGRAEQKGRLYAEWILAGAIVIKADWTGALDCHTGELRATFKGIWGLPTGDRDAPLSGGEAWGDFTLQPHAADPSRLTGKISFMSSNSWSAGAAGAPAMIPGVPGVAGGGGGKCTGGTLTLATQP